MSVSNETEAAVAVRPARARDANGIARHVVMAGGGVYEFLLEGLFDGDLSPADLLVPGIAAAVGPHSHTRCLVADMWGVVVGIAHTHATGSIERESRDWVPADRLAHLAPFDAVQDPGSCFLSALAVDPHWRGRGIADRLMLEVEKRAVSEGFDRLTLHVWADNEPARRLYRKHGFEELAIAAIPPHPRLPRAGGSLLMRKRLQAPGTSAR